MLTKNKDLLDRAMRAEAEVERLRSLENCVSLVIDRQGKTNAALLGQLDVISAYLDAELVEWKNGDQIAEIAIKFMDLQKQKLNDANSQIAAKDARIKELEAAYKIFLEANEKTNALEKDSTEKIVAALRLFDDLEAYTKRLEAAFLKAEERVLWDEVVVDGPKEGRAVRHIAIVQQKAREALERIKEGGKDESQ